MKRGAAVGLDVDGKGAALRQSAGVGGACADEDTDSSLGASASPFEGAGYVLALAFAERPSCEFSDGVPCGVQFLRSYRPSASCGQEGFKLRGGVAV